MWGKPSEQGLLDDYGDDDCDNGFTNMKRERRRRIRSRESRRMKIRIVMLMINTFDSTGSGSSLPHTASAMTSNSNQ